MLSESPPRNKYEQLIILLRGCIMQAFSYRIMVCGEPRQRMTKVCVFFVQFGLKKCRKIRTKKDFDTYFCKRYLCDIKS